MPTTVDEQSGLLRNLLASKRVLILLDNVADEAQVRSLLPGAGSSLVLITSRSSLIALDTDRRIDLDVLSREDGTRLLEGLIGQERTHADPEATAQVVDWCGRLLLALWIAGQLLAVHKTWPMDHLAATPRPPCGR
jgi:NB-ARC domain